MQFPQAHRRQILGSTAAAFAAFVATKAGAKTQDAVPLPTKGGTNPAQKTNLVPDPDGLLDLPEGFSYRIVSQLGDAMDDGMIIIIHGIKM